MRKSAAAKTLDIDDDNNKDELALAPAPTRSKSRSSRSKSKSSGKTYTHTPPPALIIWLLFSVPLVIWDCGYLLLRPHSMEGGSLHRYIWQPYALYGTIDYSYGAIGWNTKNGFVTAQGIMNVFETAMYIWYLAVLGLRVSTGDGFVRGVASKLNVFARTANAGGEEKSKIVVHGPGVALAVIVCFTSAVMTLSKTLIYGLNEACSGFVSIGHNEWKVMIPLWIVPNGAWIVAPIYMTWVLGLELIEGLERRQKAE